MGEWCCRVHGKGCLNQGGGCVTSSKPYDCNAGFANWMAGWSVAKKAWCCSTGIRAIFRCAASAFCKDRILKDWFQGESRLKHWHSCHLPVLDQLFLTGAEI